MSKIFTLVFHYSHYSLGEPLSWGKGLAFGRGKKWRRQWHPTPVLLPGKSHGQRSLIGCSPWGYEESDTTERLYFHTSEKEMATHSSSCLENPRDGGAQWAAVYGVTQSRTRLK